MLRRRQLLVLALGLAAVTYLSEPAVTMGIWSPSIAAVFNNQDPADKNDGERNQENDTRVGAAA